LVVFAVKERQEKLIFEEKLHSKVTYTNLVKMTFVTLMYF